MPLAPLSLIRTVFLSNRILLILILCYVLVNPPTLLLVHHIFSSLNGLYAKCGNFASEMTVLHLVHSICVPIPLHALKAIPLSSSIIRSVKYCWYSVVARVFKVSSNENIDCICYFSSILPVQYYLDIARMRYYKQFFVNRNLGDSNLVVFDIMHINQHKHYKMIFIKYSTWYTCSDSSLVKAFWSLFGRNCLV